MSVKQDQRAERISGDDRNDLNESVDGIGRVERPKGDERFRREQRLRSSQDFQRVRRRGRHLSGTYLSLSYARQSAGSGAAKGAANVTDGSVRSVGPARIGFSVSKRVGNAVTRNLVKRRLREAVRRRLAGLAPGWDVVLTARPSAASATYQALAQEVDHLLIRAHLSAHTAS